jgi:4-diphosphocytidyl-2-C-methyl-D-erythritol kinase
VLRSLPHFWEQTVEERKLAEMATTLGADVPFFLRSGSAVATGRGEELHYFNLDIPYTILLCHPNISVSTAWAYQQIRTASRESNCNLRDLVIQGMDDPQRLVRDLRNDFEQPVFRTHPEVAQIKSAILSGHAVYASMSGSGSAVYGLFERDGDAQAVASEFRSKGYRVFLTPPHFFPLD